MSDWNPDLYLQFKSERTQPSIDLVHRINMPEPRSILDIGCGPGNSTRMLLNRWPNSRIAGLDSSAAMIEKAKRDYPNLEWIVADASTYKPEAKFDLVFSNAVIQWIPHHQELICRFYEILSDRGVLAVQIPLFWDMPLGKLIDATGKDERWKKKTETVSELFTIHTYSFYYDQLSRLFDSIEIWQSHYVHILESHAAIVEMMRSTGLKPYLERLAGDTEKKEFEDEVLSEITIAYPPQKNGKVLLPFKRLFFIGYKLPK